MGNANAATTRNLLGRMMSSRAQMKQRERQFSRNKTMAASITQHKEEDEETKAVSNSNLWGDLGNSTSHS